MTGTISGQHDSICCSRCGTPLPGELPATNLGDKPQVEQDGAAPLPCPADESARSTAATSQPAVEISSTEPVEPPSAPDVSLDQTISHGRHALREPWLALESWEIDEDLRHMQRLLRGRRFTDLSGDGEALRFDPSVKAEPGPAASDRFFAGICTGLARILLLLGVTTLACGVSLLAWWHFGSRPDLCAAGLGCTIVGQFLLMIGLALQPERRAAEAPATTRGPTLAEHPLLVADFSDERRQPHSLRR